MGGNVIEVHGEGEFNSHLRSSANKKLVVVDFSATWCGPCQMIKPVYENLSLKYPNVLFLAVDGDENQDLCMSKGVRGFPTFHFYIDSTKKAEIVGANPQGLEQKIIELQAQVRPSFSGEGFSLGSTSTAGLDPRDARLKRFGLTTSGEEAKKTISPTAPPLTEQIASAAPVETVAPMDTSAEEGDEEEQRMLEEALKLSTEGEGEADGQSKAAQNGPPPVNESLLAQLLDMGFPEVRSRKSLLAGSTSLEAAIEWLSAHEDDEALDEPDYSAYIRDAPSAPLTAEEKQRKLQELKERAAQRRREREAEEKEAERIRELERRKTGKEMTHTKEELLAIQLKRDAELRKKEKEDAKRERERLRAELAKDKAERKARGGKLSGAPISQEDLAPPGSAPSSNLKKVEAKPQQPPEELINIAVQKLSQYRVGNDGLTAMKTLSIYIKNILEKPTEEKFRSINMENNAFKKRVLPFVGGVALLKAVGFVSNEETKVLELKGSDEGILRYALSRLDSGIQAYAAS